MNAGIAQTNAADITSQEREKFTEREFDLIKLELGLLEQRIIHLENIQYRLRQFSMALWTLTLGAGVGVTQQGNRSFFLISISGLIPSLFLYLDAWYSRAAQRYRSREIRIADILNRSNNPVGSIREKQPDAGESINQQCLPFMLLDLSDRKTSTKDIRPIYHESIWVKLSRIARLVFYGFQIVGSLSILGYSLYQELHNWLYSLLVILIFPVLIMMLFFYRNVKQRKIQKMFPLVSKQDFISHRGKK